ncbi:uncharacterized protein LOC133035537 [Cannabis sativa]|uniref:uncharacterized protein LOC133035537 n=1 Tax=Cannabis sativa TaxID=3483 RepID=UPI0029CA3F4D|nr:uncharacterized protein LOC133035537 [Cannabis sativa]
MWRAVSNCLATRVNLCIKKVLTDSVCPLCGIYAETEIHLFVTCQFASSCWEEGAVADASRNNSTLLQWMSFNAHSKDNEKLSRIVMLCWALWSARNDLIWKARVRNVSDVVAFASSSLDQYVKAQGKGNIPSQSPLKDGDGSELWKKPLSGIKLNVDAAIFDRDSKHGFGCVVRDSSGEMLSVFAGVKLGKVSPELAEIIGIREVLSWLKDRGFTDAAVETDSLVCVEAIRHTASFNSGFGLVVEDCKILLKNLSHVSLFFVKRSANRAAHFVARHSITLAECMFSINSVPLELLSILMSDSSS